MAILLIALCWLVYHPALQRFFVGDQVYYFAELNGDRSLGAGLAHWDYALSRQFNKGDELLFRPLLFVLLAAENWLFGYDYFRWNVVNLCLHLIACYLLYELLRAFTFTLLAELATLLFAVNRSIVELVVWNHLGGYIVGYSFMLLALLAAQRAIKAPSGKQRGWLLLYSLAAIAATGFHEIAVVQAVLVMGYLGWSLRSAEGLRRWQVWTATCAPVLIYGSLYSWHAWHAKHLFWTNYGEKGDAMDLASRTASTLYYWVGAGLDAWRPLPKFLPVAYFVEYVDSWTLISCNQAMVILWVIMAACLRIAFSWSRISQQWMFLILLTLLIVIYCGINCIGREYLPTYYLYFFCLTSTVLGFSLVDLNLLRNWDLRLFSVGMILLIAANAWVSSDICQKVAQTDAPVRKWFHLVSEFVEQHQHEANFSFATDNIPPLVDPPLHLYPGYPSEVHDSYLVPTTGMLFRKYYRPNDAQHVLFLQRPESTGNPSSLD